MEDMYGGEFKGKSMEEKEIYKFLFKVAGEKIWVYRPTADRIDCLVRNGDEARLFDENFWKKWANEFNFIREEYEIDFAFISPDRNSITSFGIPDDFQRSGKKTFWTLSKIREFMQEFFEYSALKLEENEKGIWGCGKEKWYLSRIDTSDNCKPAEKGSIKERIGKNPLPAPMLEIIEGKG